ncbi:uncharacterized protein LOC106057184 [Biomphalaria glabrata]|uniref:Uncharacterized protein LOC106057184 n=1 Tax=Biomphalaria glabrata TaxID=6526 RepID=A0A9W2Z219_BIOGL|nr:uncharacterized protein LOC106057184 [Biomphalaria glabrata]
MEFYLLVSVIMFVVGMPLTAETVAIKRQAPGCNYYGQWYPEGSKFIGNFKCLIYRCVNGTYILESEGCPDYLGNCRGPQDHYTDMINGRLFDSCHCYVSGDYADGYCD